MSKKIIRVLVTTMIEIESELSIDQAINEFSENCNYTYESTDNVKVISTEWRETEGVCSTEISNDGTHSILKPIKNDNGESRY